MAIKWVMLDKIWVIVRRTLEKVGSKHFGVLYAPCNLVAAGVDYKEAFKVFSNYITHVHLKNETR